MKVVGKLDVDLLILRGNSGRPVYFYYTNRAFQGTVHLGGFEQGILGLVIQGTESALPEFKGQSLNFGVVIPAIFIRETIDLLPPKP
jgi:hypothetical protein